MCYTFFSTPDSFRGPFIYDQVKAIQKTGKYEVIVFRPTSLRDKRVSYEYEGIKVYLFHIFKCRLIFSMVCRMVLTAGCF